MSTTMPTPTAMQEKAIKLADKWFRSSDRFQGPFVLTGYAGTGKAEPVDSLIPTPLGFRRMGDLKVGDYVFDRKGNITEVLEIHPQGELDVYRVTLGDGRSMLCNDEHLFSVYNGNDEFETLTVREMIDSGLHITDTCNVNNVVKYKNKYHIPTNGPVEFTLYDEDDLSLDPYIFGVLIQNELNEDERLSIDGHGMIAHVVAEGLGCETKFTGNGGWVFNYDNGEEVSLYDDNLEVDISNRYIPGEYKFNSIDVRMKLLQGIFDINEDEIELDNGKVHIKYTTPSEVLANDIREVIYSVGLEATIRRDYSSEEVVYELTVHGPSNDKEELFTLPEIRSLIHEYNIDDIISRKYDRISISSIESLGYKEEMQCISVDNDEELYLTNDFIVTHNTFTINRIIQKLGLHSDQVAFVSFTGMAASVMTKNGNPASTIHRLIYDPVPLGDGNVKFELKQELSSDIKLIVADEFSTIGNDLMQDLESFNIPIMLIGDKAQLPPVLSQANKYINFSDINLTEVMRQALDNPIIYIATKIRNGERVDFGNYGDNAVVIPKDDMDYEHIQWADQILANTNKTVGMFNQTVRRDIYDIDGPLPYVGEKILTLKNNWGESININGIEQFLVNGLLGTVSDIGRYREDIEAFEISFQPSFMDTEKSYTKILADGIYFKEGIRDDSQIYNNKELHSEYRRNLFFRKALEDTQGKKIDKFTYGYAITVYKSQGSQFGNVMFYQDYTNPKIALSSAYVAVTRAEENLIYVK